jgi:hypothetical protein
MTGIPPVADTDAEDVAWALQTAEALWKRNERVDAIVWLRRAAQAAGEAEDDDRALALARNAAELTEWLTQNPSGDAPGAVPTPSTPPTAGQAVDDLLRTSQADEYEVRVSELPVESMAMESVREPPPLQPPPPPPPAPPPAAAAPHAPPPLPPRASPSPPPPVQPSVDEELPGERASHVPTAAEKHAGMLDPWADSEEPTRERPVEQKSVAPPTPPAFEPEEVVTSAPQVGTPRVVSGAKPPPVPQKRPAPPRAPPPPPVTQSAPPPPPPAPAPPPAPPPAPSAPPPAEESAPAAAPAPIEARHSPVPPVSVRSAKPAVPPTAGVDLSAVEAFSDLPDDARVAFAGAAQLQQLALQEEVSGFALALVVEGYVDLTATIAEAPAIRLKAGEVLRSKGSIEHNTPVRLVAASDVARVATWDERAVEEAFRTCPWVEDDLRAAADRYQAEVGMTLGPLGERLDWGLRVDIASRLTLRALAEHEVYAERGKPLPGLLVVGAGELELLGDDDQPTGDPLRAGDFLFPNEVLRAGPAPNTVRAAAGGALVLCVDRHGAQEMLVTCPPLLEIFAGG